ncbi:MAG TPA: cupin domain-containing protein [Candidatus Methylomirabilis sp.]|nr:cupin domain-containing protein [Candidatus Methylomirabilis sp.]HSD51884.1 cupin domain-containing protein [Candidatus Methylomirabilis sp.]
MAVSKPILNIEGSGKSVEYGNGSRAEIVVGGPESGGEYAVVRYRVVSGDEPQLHTHSKEDEMVFVVEGELTAYVGDARVDVSAGAFAALPRGVPHTIRVKGNSATLILTLVPAGLERFFVPESDRDADPATFGLELHGLPPA